MVSTRNSAGCRTASMAARTTGSGIIIPVDVSLCTTQTALMTWAASSARTRRNSATSTPTRQSAWTAPGQPGPVPVTVGVNDGKGGTASDSVTIQVVQPRSYTFEDVHFEFDRYTLRPDALSILDDAINAMRANPGLRLTIEGHTCNIGTAEYNLALGERRAKAVRDYLVSRGVAADRLNTVSFGEEQPKYDNSREETRRLNRRAALVVDHRAVQFRGEAASVAGDLLGFPHQVREAVSLRPSFVLAGKDVGGGTVRRPVCRPFPPARSRARWRTPG